MTDALLAIDRAIAGICPCGAEPAPGLAYCGDDCTPTHIAGDTDQTRPGEYGAQSTPMRWRPDLVSAHDDSRLALSTQFRRGQYTATVYEINGSDGVHCRLDDGNRFVGVDADGYQFVSDEGLEPVWLRLERELGNSRHLDPDGDPWADVMPPRPYRIGEATRQALCAWLTDNGINPNDVPRWSQIYVTGDTIRLPIVVRDDQGATRMDPHDRNSVLTEEKTFPLLTRSIPAEVAEAEFVHLNDDAVLLALTPTLSRFSQDRAAFMRSFYVTATIDPASILRNIRTICVT